MNSSEFITTHQSRINQYLETVLPSKELKPTTLHAAMRYSVLNGGKRIRPLLIYAVAQTFNKGEEKVDPIAAAVEMIHCYSLIHDDLPAMDNDDLRRGLPTCHKAFDEATAILAGDALQALAFEVLADNLKSQIQHDKIVEMLVFLAKACGSIGMAGGQALDISATGGDFRVADVEEIHSKKTGALISASISMASIASDCSQADKQNLFQYSQLLGLAFQIQDDILDIESSTEILGKQQGADLISDKLTYPRIVGLEKAKQKVEELYASALRYLENLSVPAPILIDLSRFMLSRES
jgi:geranylgeranyl pyrophosphate synthase